MSKLKIKNARMLTASGNLLILNFAFLILLTWDLEFGHFRKSQRDFASKPRVAWYELPWV
jgi:hypothetical protein